MLNTTLPLDPSFYTFDLINYDLHFPKCISALLQFKELIKLEGFGTPTLTKKVYMDLLESELLPKFNEEINEKLGSNYWNELLEQGEVSSETKHEVCKHTVNVLHQHINH